MANIIAVQRAIETVDAKKIISFRVGYVWRTTSRKTSHAVSLIIYRMTRSAMSMGDKTAESAETLFGHSRMRQEHC